MVTIGGGGVLDNDRILVPRPSGAVKNRNAHFKIFLYNYNVLDLCFL